MFAVLLLEADSHANFLHSFAKVNEHCEVKLFPSFRGVCPSYRFDINGYIIRVHCTVQPPQNQAGKIGREKTVEGWRTFAKI